VRARAAPAHARARLTRRRRAQELLSSDFLEVRSEEGAAGAALAWLNHAREERAAHAPDLVAVLRVEALSAATRAALQRRLHAAADAGGAGGAEAIAGVEGARRRMDDACADCAPVRPRGRSGAWVYLAGGTDDSGPFDSVVRCVPRPASRVPCALPL
jgi:hypothetical protein